MGVKFIDQYSLLHFAVGIVAYFWGLKLWVWILVHILFEFLENTPIGMNFINTYIKVWPGGKPHTDSFINTCGDTIFAILGWLCARNIDKLGKNSSGILLT